MVGAVQQERSGETPGPAPAGDLEPSRATRSLDRRMIAGVCSGLADHLGWSVTVIRIGFVALALTQLIGIGLYAVLWLLLPPAAREGGPLGVESHTRTGLRQAGGDRRPRDLGLLIALLLVGVGAFWFLEVTGLGLSAKVLLPVLVAALGVALIWSQADSTAVDSDVRAHRLIAPFLARRGWLAVLRVVVGVALVAVAFALVLVTQIPVSQFPAVIAMVALAVLGLMVVAAPWLHRSRRALATAREKEVRADARADMAAHLHDSVLQTLALIQRQADDPKAVQTLARRQERELRSWLYGDAEEQAEQRTLRGALAEIAAEVETEHGVAVEVVGVGDVDLAEWVLPLVQATREAIWNAAKHSGASQIDVYVEADDEGVEVFVRDRGVGFDAAAVLAGDDAGERMGVRRSIVERMTRHHGTATVSSEPGEGTEIHLMMKR